jgi:putative hemolysin
MRNTDRSSEETMTRNQNLVVELAASEADVIASQRLRLEVFAREMGAKLASESEGLDRDRFDPFCDHLLVRDTASGEVVGSTRILTDDRARKAGGFYSETEFDLSNLLPLPGRAIEIGRTCIHSDYRHGGTLGVLWSGLAQFMSRHGYDFMMGCASIGMEDGGYQARAIMDRVRERYLAPEVFRVTPKLPLPPLAGDGEIKPHIPPLLKAYLRAGVYVCGEACWDPDFNVADVFVLQDMNNLNARYERHFIQRAQGKDRKHAADKKTL